MAHSFSCHEGPPAPKIASMPGLVNASDLTSGCPAGLVNVSDVEANPRSLQQPRSQAWSLKHLLQRAACFSSCGCLLPPLRDRQAEGQCSRHTRSLDKAQVLAEHVLDLGFLHCELRERRGSVAYEIHMQALNSDATQDGIAELLNYLDAILTLDLVAEGFELTYDLRKLYVPPAEIFSEILCWSMEVRRREKWSLLCKRWKVMVAEEIFFLVRYALSAAFYVCPPMCRIELVTDTVGGQYASFLPPVDDRDLLMEVGYEFAEDVLSNMFSALITPLSETAEAGAVSPEDRFPLWSSTLDLIHIESDFDLEPDEQEALGEPTITTSSGAVDGEESGLSPNSSVHCGFAVVSQGFDKDANLGFLRITGTDATFTEKGLAEMMNFMDDFVNSAKAAHGFSITYDLRQLRIPSMSMVMRVADWGKDPERQKKWEALNTVCKVVLSPGVMFAFSKGVLNSFFYVCPPVCRTFLCTDPDEPEENSIVFEPPPKADKEQLCNSESESTESGSSSSDRSDLTEQDVNRASKDVASMELAKVHMMVAPFHDERLAPRDDYYWRMYAEEI